MVIADFLLARIAEDEAMARAAIVDGPQSAGFVDGQRVEKMDDGRWSTRLCQVEGVGITIYDEGGHTDEQAAHIARHDPARGLAECEAKRRIVELFPNHPDHSDGWGNAGGRVLELLALPYADHPDYREEWAC